MPETAVVETMVMVETRKIRPYQRNPRKNDATVAKLVELIPKVGFNVPLVLDRHNVIVKGHARWKAAIRLGMRSIPCVYTDADEETVRLDRLADNRVQEFSKWDTSMLQSELGSLDLGVTFDMSILNFEVELPKLGNDQAVADNDEPELAAAKGEEPAGETPDVDDWIEAKCPDCGHVMFIRKDVFDADEEGRQAQAAA